MWNRLYDEALGQITNIFPIGDDIGSYLIG